MSREWHPNAAPRPLVPSKWSGPGNEAKTVSRERHNEGDYDANPKDRHEAEKIKHLIPGLPPELQ